MKDFEGYTVLIADDEEIAREIVANIVEDLGAKCITAKDGDELLERLNAPGGEKIDLVLTDINMPGKSGIEACSEFRASEHPKAKRLPIIGISADTNPAIFDNAISAGMNGMTMKPLTRETLHAHFHITLKDKRANEVFCERIQQALAKSLFFSTVSHDIRTPLNAIIGFSQLLKMGFDSKEEHDNAVESINVSSKTLLQLVNDILDLSKLESGKMEICPEPTETAKVLEEIVSSFRFSNQNKELELRCKAGDMPLLMLDPQRIRQIAFNLVGNAVKFTKEGFVELRASFEPTGPEKGTFTMAVQDTGCGISEADQKRLASPFVQVGCNKAKAKGTGLGLAICRQLAKAMGGDLAIASTLGVGTTFSIVIPNLAAASSGTTAADEKAEKTCSLPQSVAAGLRVLFADDTRINHIVLKSLLKKLGVTDVTSVANGADALALLEREGAGAFDLVITDMFMPQMTGEELVSAIRADAKLSALPVYLFTADVEFKDTYAEKGFSGVLIKPATLESLKEACIAAAGK
ncbi:MAG: response regulator [Victivallales bacterium]|nr:response regulator [Victivallales bacterium]